MLRHLNNQEMLAITSNWSSNPEARATFLSIPDIAPLHPKVVKVHAELLAVQPAPDTASAEAKKLLVTATKVDVEHDANVRAVAAGIEADRTYCLAARPPQLARAELAEQVHAKLFPTGLAIVNASLLAESGNATRVAALLEQDHAIAEFLQEIPLRDGLTVLDLTRRWVAAGKQLGKLEHQRSVLAAKNATKHVDLATFAALRARWLRLVSQVLSALELSDAPEETIAIIRDPVLLASERAGNRYTDASEPTPDATASAGPDEGAAVLPIAATA